MKRQKEIKLTSHRDVDQWAKSLRLMGEKDSVVMEFQRAAHEAIRANPGSLPFTMVIDLEELEQRDRCSRCGQRFKPNAKVLVDRAQGEAFHPECAPVIN